MKSLYRKLDVLFWSWYTTRRSHGPPALSIRLRMLLLLEALVSVHLPTSLLAWEKLEGDWWRHEHVNGGLPGSSPPATRSPP